MSSLPDGLAGGWWTHLALPLGWRKVTCGPDFLAFVLQAGARRNSYQWKQQSFRWQHLQKKLQVFNKSPVAGRETQPILLQDLKPHFKLPHKFTFVGTLKTLFCSGPGPRPSPRRVGGQTPILVTSPPFSFAFWNAFTCSIQLAHFRNYTSHTFFCGQLRQL